MTLVYFISCTSTADKRINATVEAESKVREMLDKQKSNPPVTKLILNYKFGMTKNEVDANTKQLYKTKVIHKGKFGDPTYDLIIDKKKYPCFVQFEFYKGKLCQIYINTVTLEPGATHTNDQIFEKVKEQYIRKYTDSSSVEFPEGGIQFVRSNLLLEIDNSMSSTSIVYQDYINYNNKLSEDVLTHPNDFKSSNDKFIDEIKENKVVIDAAITDVDFLYIAVVDDNTNKQAMATYYCRLAASETMNVKAVKSWMQLLLLNQRVQQKERF